MLPAGIGTHGTLYKLFYVTNLAETKCKEKRWIVFSHASDFMEWSSNHWWWSEAGDRAGRSAASHESKKQNWGRSREWETFPSPGGSTFRKTKLPMKSYLKTLIYINHRDLRCAAAPFQTLVSQTCSHTPAAEVGSCLPRNAGKQPGRAHQSSTGVCSALPLDVVSHNQHSQLCVKQASPYQRAGTTSRHSG